MTDLRARAADAPASLEPLEAEHRRYAALLGTAFTATDTTSGHAVLELDRVSPLRATAGQEAFSLEFVGLASARLSQGTHLLEHEVLGPTALFLVPLGIEDDRVRYEAVFARLVSVRRDSSPNPAGRSS